MNSHSARWGKAVFWGSVTAILYALMFSYSDLILHLAHTTPEACVVDLGTTVSYFHKLDATACAAQGGHLEPSKPWHVLVPILFALAISFTHGAFTGLFWDLMGLKPAGPPPGRK
jgi:hypothetical protein